MSKVLLIEDEQTLASALQRVLEVEKYEVTTATDPAKGLALARKGDFEVVVTDLKMPGISGMDVIKDLHENRPQLPVILMTGHHTTETAIEAMKFGAYDYILKPPDPPEFIGLIEKAVSNSRLMSEQVELGHAPGASKDAIIGSSRVMQNVYKEIGRVAAMPVTVLIRGETGTGKELVARAIYQHSERADKPFIEVNCVAIPENLLESELFGHEPGAFTDAKIRRIGRFEQANHGTILLDEIGDMSAGTQAKLLRVLQNGMIQRLGGRETIAVDVRVIAATHRNLEEAIVEKGFREDLYYRLNQFVIKLPPLRDRTEDIPDLVKYFVQRYSGELGLPSPGAPTDETIAYLRTQPWAGNVRELRNVIRKALLLARGYPLTVEIAQAALTQGATAATVPRLNNGDGLASLVSELLARAETGEVTNVQGALAELVDRELFSQAIQLAKGDITKAAAWIGISRPTLREKLIKYGLYRSGS